MVEKRNGVAAAVAETAGDAPDVEPALLPLPLDMPDAGPPPEKRGRGRPKGSRNLSTKQLRTLILSRHEHPLVALAETYSMPAEELAKRLECSVAAAFDRQLGAAKTVAEFIEPKLARVQVTDGEGEALPVMNIIVGGHAGGALADELPAGAKLLNSLPVIDGDASELENAELENSDQAVDPIEEGKDQASDR